MEKRITSVCAAVLMCCVGVATAQDKPAPAPAKADPKQPAAEPKKTEKKTDEVSLKVGDKAPALAVSKWVKGEPITGFEKGRVYVVEFWATWCGPCKKAIPHVTELQAKFKDKGVTMIGVSVWEEDQAKIAPFVKDQGDKMNYTVAADDVPKDADANEGKMATTWLKAAGRNGIPCTFVVDKDSKIAWIGHPMNGLDRVLAAVVDGTFDAKKEADSAAKLADANKKVSTAMRAEDWDGAIKAMDEVASLNPDMAGQIGVQKFMLLLTKKKDYPAAYALASKLGDKELKDDAPALNELAWTILDNKGVEKRDFPLAEKLATRACEVTKFEDAMILDTLALACFENGKVERAIELQTKAVSLAPDGDMKDEMQERLDKFKAKKPGN